MTKKAIKEALKSLPTRENGYNGDEREVAGQMVYCRIISGRRYYHCNAWRHFCAPLDQMADALKRGRPYV